MKNMNEKLMNEEEFINYLKEHDVRFVIKTDPRLDGNRIWIYDKGIYDLKKKYPKKYDNLYVRYIRVHVEDYGKYYVRDNGWCDYYSQDKLLRIIEKEYM